MLDYLSFNNKLHEKCLVARFKYNLLLKSNIQHNIITINTIKMENYIQQSEGTILFLIVWSFH
jgi:hypothetical protein